MPGTSDLTIIYYTANLIHEKFFNNTKKALLVAARDLPIISVSQQPVDIGANICIGRIGQGYINIYKQALIGAYAADTRFIAMAEDDILYSPDHFICHTPTHGTFAYNVNVESMFTWVEPPVFGHKNRRNLHSLICERDLFIAAMEERFAKYPNECDIKHKYWSEPGKYEDTLGVTVQKSELFESEIPNIAFSHKDGYSFKHLGTRKRLDTERKAELPYWGSAEHVKSLYS